jgi:hypothetical protein
MGSSNLLDGRPAPVSQIGWFPEALLDVRCAGACGKTNRLHIGRLVRRHHIDPMTRIHAIGPRLRCATCGGAGQVTGVSGWKR